MGSRPFWWRVPEGTAKQAAQVPMETGTQQGTAHPLSLPSFHHSNGDAAVAAALAESPAGLTALQREGCGRRC